MVDDNTLKFFLVTEVSSQDPPSPRRKCILGHNIPVPPPPPLLDTCVEYFKSITLESAQGFNTRLLPCPSFFHQPPSGPGR